MRDYLRSAKRIVVKAGTSILTSKKGHFSKKSLHKLCSQLLREIKLKRELVLVSSGAIALGMEANHKKQRPSTMSELQAYAAIGQGKLMHAYEQFFTRRGMHTAQLLLTKDGLEIRDRFLRARQTLQTLLKIRGKDSCMKTLPVINENDTVSTEEIAFGDNDGLAVQVAHLIHADLLILLSDVDGFYLKDGSRLRQVSSEKEIDSKLIKHVKDDVKETTVGGMKAKLTAARIAMRLGVPLLILDGHDDEIIQKALSGEDVGTLFLPGKPAKSARKKWIAFSAARKGTIIVDDGAYQALRNNHRSLLPSGMVRVRGAFERGAVVELESSSGQVFGRGVVRYGSRELAVLAGKKTDEIQQILGYKSCDEAIHRNDLVLWD